MRQFKILVCFLLAAFLLTACSFHKKEQTNLHQSNVKNTKPLVIPDNLSSKEMEDYYPLPQLEAQPPSVPVSMAPPGSMLAKQVAATKK